MPDLFFGIGAHCALTIAESPEGEKTGYLSYEPATNHSSSTEHILPEKLRHLAEDEAAAEKQAACENILTGAATYIKGADKFQLLGNLTGVVCSDGVVNIDKKNSPHHQRTATGVEEKILGLFNFPADKLMYAPMGAAEIVRLLPQQFAALNEVQRITEELTTQSKHAVHAVRTRLKFNTAATPDPGSYEEKPTQQGTTIRNSMQHIDAVVQSIQARVAPQSKDHPAKPEAIAMLQRGARQRMGTPERPKSDPQESSRASLPCFFANKVHAQVRKKILKNPVIDGITDACCRML